MILRAAAYMQRTKNDDMLREILYKNDQKTPSQNRFCDGVSHTYQLFIPTHPRFYLRVQ